MSAAVELQAAARDGRTPASMDRIKLNPTSLQGGTLNILGFKHASTLIMAACVASGQKALVANVPEILDVRVLAQIIGILGVSVRRSGGSLQLDPSGVAGHDIPDELGVRIHGAMYLIPALLGRLGRVRYASFGGCAIGDAGTRPIQHVLDVLARFGARFRFDADATTGECAELRACEIDIMDFSDVAGDLTGPLVSGATKTAILAALSVKHGSTVIRNAYLKPDVTELLEFVAACGYGVRRTGTDVLIQPPASADARPDDVEFTLVSDISEVMTYVALSILADIQIRLQCRKPEKVRDGLAAEIGVLDAMGIDLRIEDGLICAARRHAGVRHVDIVVKSTGIYSDHQPLFALMLCYASGPSIIRETVWKERFAYVAELNKLGARIEKRAEAIFITPKALHAEPAVVHAADLRAAAVLAVAGLIRGGETTIECASHLERGYSNFAGNLAKLNSHIELLG